MTGVRGDTHSDGTDLRVGPYRIRKAHIHGRVYCAKVLDMRRAPGDRGVYATNPGWTTRRRREALAWIEANGVGIDDHYEIRGS